MAILWIRIVVLIAAFSVQSLPGQQLNVFCTTSTDGPAIMPLEGVAELASDLLIKCQGGSPTLAGQAIPKITLRVYTSSNLTSRLLGTSPDLSEALLLIDEPAPRIQLACPRLPCSITADSAGPYNGTAGHYNVFQATQLGGNVIEWDGVPFDAPGPGRFRTLRITNLRANLNQQACCITLGQLGTQLVTFVTIIGSSPISVSNQQSTIALGQFGLKVSSTTAAIPSFLPHNASGPTTDFTMTFAEVYASAFKPRTVAANPEDTSSNANQNVPGGVFASASGFYNASFPGTYAGAGLATQGTRLIAHFEKVPPGVVLFVTERPTTASRTLRVQLVSTGPDGDGPYYAVAGAPNGFAPITVYNGSAVAVWEVLSANPAEIESAEFGVAVGFTPEASSANALLQIGTATVRGSFAPLSRVALASLTDPVPRFAESPARPAFTITDRGFPVVDAVVNAASYAPGGPVAPGSVVAIFGRYLTLKASTSLSGPVAALGGTTVSINGIVTPIYATTLGQVNVEIPWELSGLTEASLKITVDGQEIAPLTIKLAGTAPYIFTSGEQAFIARQIPVQPGSLLIIYGTGFGPVRNQPATGSPALQFTSTTVTNPSVSIGGVPAEVTFSGLVPGVVGVWQVSIKLPEGVTFGRAVPVRLSISGIDANAVSISLP